jgi:acid phosphatase (class A)
MRSIFLNLLSSGAYLLLGSLAVIQAADLDAPHPVVPARGHYAKLGRLNPAASADNLAVDDEKRFVSKPAFMEKVKNLPIEFVRVPLDQLKLPVCPANSSAQTRAEIDYLLRLQEQRSEAEGKRALYYADWGYSSALKPGDADYAKTRANLFYVGRSIGSWFNPDSLPLTAALVGRMWRDASFHIWSLKFKYARIRPVVIDPRIKNLQETDWAAFPSGHAAYAHILAYLYSELAPEFSDIFLTDARNIAHSREIIGVHYPSDSEAGRIFARHFVNALLQNEKFKAEFAKVREEWDRVRAMSPD